MQLIKEEKGYRVIGVSQEFNDDKTATAKDKITGEYIYAELTIQNGTVVCDYTQSNLTQGTIDYAIDAVRNHGKLTIINATIENNSVPDQLGFAVDNHSGYAPAYLTIKNSIITISGSDWCEAVRQYKGGSSYSNNLYIEDCNEFIICVQTERDDHSLLSPAKAQAKVYSTDAYGRDCVSYYSSLGTALSIAQKPEDKVVVLKKCEEQSLAIPIGVTLDLNGNELYCMMLTVMGSGEVIDSSDGEGFLNTMVFYHFPYGDSKSYSSTYMPLYDDDDDVKGYRFFSYEVQFGYDKNKYDPKWYFLAQIIFNNAYAYELLETEKSKITFGCDISFQTSDSAEIITIPHCQVGATTVSQYAAMALRQIADGKTPTATLGVLISDLDVISGGQLHIEVYVESVIKSGVSTTGFVKSSGQKTLTIN